MTENIIFEYELKENEIFNITSVSGGGTKVSIISYDKDQIPLIEQRYFSMSNAKTSNAKAKDRLDKEGREKFEKLRVLRMELADSEGIRPYMVFNDKTLVEMVEMKPASIEELLEISGVGYSKADKYGEVFLDALLEA